MRDRNKVKTIIGTIVNACEMPKGNLVCALASVLLLILPSIVPAIVYQVLPADMPPRLPSQIQGKYRIIEHDRSRKLWFVYDVPRWKKYRDKEFSEETIKMYPPIHQYISCRDGWAHDVINKTMNNEYMMELVTIIDKGKPLKQPTPEGKQLSMERAQAIVEEAFYPVNKHLWSFKSAQYKNGVLICAFSQSLPDAIGVWWAKGNKVYSVNGIARSKTKNFEVTFDPNIDVPKAYERCKSYK